MNKEIVNNNLSTVSDDATTDISSSYIDSDSVPRQYEDQKAASLTKKDNWLKRIEPIRKIGLYNQYVESHRNPDNADLKLTRDIAKDVHRSFGGRASTTPEQTALREVLSVFGRYEEGVGYTQGMGFIVNFALKRQSSYDIEARENAFWLLIEASRRLPNGFFTKAAHDEIQVFEHVIRQFAPEVENHLRDELYPACCYLIPRWFLSLFVFSTPDVLTQALWNEVLFPFPRQDLTYRLDLLLNLHRIALALVKIHSVNLLEQAKVATHALDRISKRASGSLVELELLHHRDTRIGMEFVQNIVEATMKDTSTINLLLKNIRQSPLTVEAFIQARQMGVTRSASFYRIVKCVVMIQRWYRLMKARQHHRRRRSASQAASFVSISEWFTACAGISSHRDM